MVLRTAFVLTTLAAFLVACHDVTGVRITNDSANEVVVEQRGLPTTREVIKPGREKAMSGLDTTETEVVYTVFSSDGTDLGCLFLSVPPDKVGEVVTLLVSSLQPCPP